MPTPNTQLIASHAAYALIREFENFESRCYRCPSNIPTIGFGHTGPEVVDGMREITLMEAEDMLKADVAKFEKPVRQHVKVPLTQGQFDALVSILFNAGEGRVKGTLGPNDEGRDGIIRLRDGRPSTLLRKLNAGDRMGAAEQFLVWNKGRDKSGAVVVMPGLVRRRAAEKALFLSTVGIS